MELNKMTKLRGITEITNILTGEDIIKFKNFIKEVVDHDETGLQIKSSNGIEINFWYIEEGSYNRLCGEIGRISFWQDFEVCIFEYEDKIKIELGDFGFTEPLKAVVRDGDCYFYDYRDLLEVLNKAFNMELYKIEKEIEYYD